MNKLEEIGFYTLSDQRAATTSITSQMKRCELIILEKCNFRCGYCRGLKDEIYGDRKIKQLSLEEIKQNIDYWCEGQPLENIRFSGGEPTLHKNIVEIISYAKEKGIKRIAISTNGSNKIELYKKLIDVGCNDFSISLDGCCSGDVDKMAGVTGVFETIVNNIREISKSTYVTVGVVLTPENIQSCIDTIKFADSLGISDIRIISAAQWNQPIPDLDKIPQEILDKYPILKYRVNHFSKGINVRGIQTTDNHRCGLMLDDSIIAGEYVFKCIIHMREGGQPVCKVSKDMRQKRFEYMMNSDTHEDPICKKNCLDVCRDFNNIFDKLNPLGIENII